MAVSSVGIGSGLDVESIVTQMVALEKRPLETLKAKSEFIDAKISVQGEIRSMVTDLNDAVLALSLDRTWNSVKVSASGSNVSATTTGIAAQGSYNLNVKQLSQSQTMVSSKLNAGATMGSAGTFVFTVGHQTTKTVHVEVDSSDTLEKVAAKISESGAGILASVVTDADGKQQLMLRSRESGLESKFDLAIEGAITSAAGVTPVTYGSLTAGSNLASLAGGDRPDIDAIYAAVDPEHPFQAQPVGAAGFYMSQLAQNAKMTLNGVEVESNTNTFASTVPGLSISVNAIGTSLLSVTQDKDAIKEKIQKFVDSYNALNKLLAEATKYSEDNKTAGVFQGDSSIVSMQNAFRMLTQVSAANATGAFKRLADIGIELGNSVTGSAKTAGELVVNTTKLDTALNDMASLKELFAAKDVQSQGGGIAVRFKSFTGGLMDLEGALNTKEASLDKEKDRNADEQDRVNQRATRMEDRLRKQYTALDVKMASLSSLSSYVEQMVASWNKSKD